MKNSIQRKGATRFYETVAQQAISHPVHPLTITDEANDTVLGLILYDDNLEQHRAAHLLRKTALTLGGVARRMGAETTCQPDAGQVTVEERSQLFTLFNKGSGHS